MATTELVLVPGSGCDGRTLAPPIEAPQGMARVRVLDNTAPARIDRLALAALAALPERFAVAGLSQGGLVALEKVRAAAPRVAGLGQLDTLPGPDLRIDRVRHRLAIARLAARAFGADRRPQVAAVRRAVPPPRRRTARPHAVAAALRP